MKLLHTSDWHVGRSIRGHSRAAEHTAVLEEIVALAGEHEVDLVMVTGDLFDTASPTAESEEIVYRALVGLCRTGARVVVIAGNHDHPQRLAAVAPVLASLDVVVAHQVTRPDAGGVIELTVRSGEPVRLVLVPFLSRRGIVRADELMAGDAVEHQQLYAERYRRIVEVLGAGLRDDMVNLIAAHAFVDRALSGGGERAAHLGLDYAVAASVFPGHAHYVALGHLHRAQRVDGPTQIHYCGSPLALDFGEVEGPKQVNLVEAHAGVPAKVTPLFLANGRPLRTVRGTLDDLRAVADELTDCWVRVHLREPARAGIADEVRALVPTVVDVVAAPPERAGTDAPRVSRSGRSPQELFEIFCREREHTDPRTRALFAELLEHAYAPATD